MNPNTSRNKFSGRAVGGPLDGRTVRAPIPMRAVVRRGIGTSVVLDGVYVWAIEDGRWYYRLVPPEVGVFATAPQFVEDITDRVARFLSVDPEMLKAQRARYNAKRVKHG